MKRTMIGLLIGALLLHAGECSPYSVLVSWAHNSESDLAGYKLYYGTDIRIYGTVENVGMITSHQVDNLAEGVTYYFAVTALGSSGAESAFSDEVLFYEPGSGGGGGSGDGGGGTSTGSAQGGGGGGGCFIQAGASTVF